MVLFVPGIIIISGFPNSLTSEIYLRDTLSILENTSKSVKLEILGSFITAISAREPDFTLFLFSVSDRLSSSSISISV